MREIPILFSTSMVQAILEGRKTVTRRIMKPQIKPCEHHLYVEAEWKDEPTEWVLKDGYTYCGLCGNGVTPKHDYKGIKMKWQQGDVLWVRETWKPNDIPMGWPYHYLAANDTFTRPSEEKWKPSIFMPKEACRLFLQIESVRIERLQDMDGDIADECDSLREGIMKFHHGDGNYGYHWKGDMDGENFVHPYEAFKDLWVNINGKESWNSNPWVWRIEFKKTERPPTFLNRTKSREHNQ